MWIVVNPLPTFLEQSSMLNSESVQDLSFGKAILSYIIVALFLFFEMGVQVSPSVMTNELMRDLHIGVLGLGLMSGFYFYTYTLMQIPSGMLFDRYRPRYVITLSIMICSLGCLAFGAATNIYLGSLARMLMGFGSAFAFVAVLVVTADLFSARYFALITGITQMLAALGAMSGQMPLSFAVERFGWRQTMILLALIGFMLAVVVWLVLNYKKEVFSVASTKRKTVEYRFRHILLNKQSWIIALYACFLWAPMSGFASLWGVPFLLQVYHLSHANAALVCSMMWFGLAAASPILGWLSTAYRARVWPLAISSLIGAIFFAILLAFHFNALYLLMIIVFLCGAACAGQALSFTVVKEINSPQQRGAAIAFNNMAVVISGAIFQPLLGRLLEFHCEVGNAMLTQCENVHFRMSMLLILAVYGVGFLLATFFIKESFKQCNH
ncbi:MAG: hypothetical protein A3F10_00145 [Coxiella sp. RIFCSPHIGHO2_12_FULL_42_15]|nr:MAG: hypothetical protein A3F10_00145 [Coxiella sp. RIFCSPHIGHO2_12_FULL_42_15]